MDINNRKTALDDDSILYQKRDADSNKQDIKDLNQKGKLQYFADYYLMKVVIVLVSVILVGYLIYSSIFNRQETVLTVCCIGNTMITENEAMAEDLRPVFEPLEKNESLYITNYYLEDYNQQMSFSTHLAARDIDIVILDKAQFDRLSGQGMFADLSQVLDPSLYEELKDQLIDGKVISYTTQGEIESYSDPYPMVIDVTDNPVIKDYVTYSNEVYLGICIGTQRTEKAQTFIDYLFHPEDHPLSNE